MDIRHQEYAAYYQARYQKVAKNPWYPHTAAAERELLDAITTAPSLEAFDDVLRSRNLNVKCAVARVRDDQTARARFYGEMDQPIRAGSALEILENLDSRGYTNVMDLQTMVSEVEMRWMTRIFRDEHLIEEFWGDWKVLEDIECYRYAVVPERWKAERSQSAAADIARGRESWRTHTLPQVRKFDPDYQTDHDLLREPRHRRKVPVEDGVFERRLAGHRRYVGVE